MSKTKEMEAMLVAATDYIAHLLREQKQGHKFELSRSDEAGSGLTVGQLMKWRTARRRELRELKTVEAKVVTAAVEKDRRKRDRKQTVAKESKADRRKRNAEVHKTIEKVIDASADGEHLTKGVLMGSVVHTSRTTKHKVIGVVRRSGERCVKLDNELTVPVSRLHQSAPGKFKVMPEK